MKTVELTLENPEAIFGKQVKGKGPLNTPAIIHLPSQNPFVASPVPEPHSNAMMIAGLFMIVMFMFVKNHGGRKNGIYTD